MNFKAIEGEGWGDVYDRVKKYYLNLPKGLNLAFTHGGAICVQTYPFGIEDIVPHCSAVCFRLN